MSDDSTVPGQGRTRPEPVKTLDEPDGDRPTLPREQPGGPVGGVQKLGRYVLLELIGTGGMGEVYAAFDPTLDRKVALKLLFPSAEDGSRAQMLAEARALARLTHPNVVAVHEVGEANGRAYLALEYADGITLAEWLRDRPRTWAEIIEVFLEAGRGLHAAHLAGLVHRDFKPNNVMLRKDGRVQLLDFGIARTSAPRPPVNASPTVTTVAGTPGFMSPEQLMGELLDARSDQFSFCAALYEALYGVLPFGNAADEGQVRRIQGQSYAQPPAKVDVPRGLLPLLKRGLAAAPAARFSSMGLLMRQIKNKLPADRRMVLLIGALATVAAVSVGASVLKPRPVGLACAPKHAEIAEQWQRSQRERARLRLGADPEGVVAQMDGWLAALASTTRRVCADFATGLEGKQLLREQQCLDERQRDFLQAAAAVADGADEGRQLLDEAAPPEACLSTAVAAEFDDFQRLAPGRRALADANRAWLTGNWLVGLGLCEAATRQAEALQSPELRSGSLRLEGLGYERLGELKLAEQTLHRAAQAAEGATDESRAAAWVSLARVVGVRAQRVGDGAIWAAYAHDPVQRFPQRKELRATLELVEARLKPGAESRARLEVLADQLGPGHPLRPVVRAELARADPASFGAGFGEALTLLETLPHPPVPTLLGVADALEGIGPRPAEARRLLAVATALLLKVPGSQLAQLQVVRTVCEAGAAEEGLMLAAQLAVATKGDPAVAELANLELGACQLANGEPRAALETLSPLRGDLRFPARGARAQLLLAEAAAAAHPANPKEARTRLQEAIARATQEGLDPGSLASAREALSREPAYPPAIKSRTAP